MKMPHIRQTKNYWILRSKKRQNKQITFGLREFQVEQFNKHNKFVYIFIFGLVSRKYLTLTVIIRKVNNFTTEMHVT